MLRIIDVDYLGNYTLELVFNNRERRRINMLPHLDKGIFKTLKDEEVFIQYALTSVTLEWVNGIDIAPEFFLENGELIESNVDLDYYY